MQQEPGDRTPLESAHSIVHDGHRGEAYGHPLEIFSRTAGLWRELFGWDVEPKDVALALKCLKLARLRQTPGHRDSIVDDAGYAELYWMTVDSDRV